MIQKSTSKPLRKQGWNIILDERKFFRFPLPDGRIAEAKAMTVEDARKQVEQSLNITLEDAA